MPTKFNCFLLIATRLAPMNMDYWMIKRDLLIQLGDQKREMECYQRMISVLPLELLHADYYMELVRKLTLVCFIRKMCCV